MSDPRPRRGIFGRRRGPSPEVIPPPPPLPTSSDEFAVAPLAPTPPVPRSEDDWHDLVDRPFEFALEARTIRPPEDVMEEMARIYQVTFPVSGTIDLAPILQDSPRLSPHVNGFRNGERIARELTDLDPSASPESHLETLATALEDLDDISTERHYFRRGSIDKLLWSYGAVRGAGIDSHENLDLARAALGEYEGPDLDIEALYDDCHLVGGPFHNPSTGGDERRLPQALLLAAISGYSAPRDLAIADRQAAAHADGLTRELSRMTEQAHTAREQQLGPDTAVAYDQLLTASREEALLLGVSGHSPEANFQRYAVANLLMEELSRRRADEDAHWEVEPHVADVPEPFALRLLNANRGDVAATAASTEFPRLVAKDLGAAPTL